MAPASLLGRGQNGWTIQAVWMRTPGLVPV